MADTTRYLRFDDVRLVEITYSPLSFADVERALVLSRIAP